jgi:antitoxin VapB
MTGARSDWPKDMAFPPSFQEARIINDGARQTIAPANAVWDDVFDVPGIDIGDRVQLPHQQRSLA